MTSRREFLATLTLVATPVSALAQGARTPLAMPSLLTARAGTANLPGRGGATPLGAERRLSGANRAACHGTDQPGRDHRPAGRGHGPVLARPFVPG